MGIATFGLILILLSVGKMGMMTPFLKSSGPWITLIGFSVVIGRLTCCCLPRHWTKPFFGRKTREKFGMDRDLSITKDTNKLFTTESIERYDDPEFVERFDGGAEPTERYDGAQPT